MDGELEGELPLRITDHLGRCYGCRSPLEDQQALDRLLGSLPGVGVSAELGRTVLCRVRESQVRSRTAWGAVGRPWRSLQEHSEWIFEFLDTSAVPSSHYLHEFSDVPQSFVGYAYFRLLAERR
jgi:hypothetical protein